MMGLIVSRTGRQIPADPLAENLRHGAPPLRVHGVKSVPGVYVGGESPAVPEEPVLRGTLCGAVFFSEE